MNQSQEMATKKSNLITIAGFGTIIILTLILIILMINSIGSINSKIESINKSLELESEDHYMNIQREVAESVVIVFSFPVNSGNSSSDVIFLDDTGQSWNIGTGFSIDNKGTILTANHVVQGADKVVVIHQTTTTSDVSIDTTAIPIQVSRIKSVPDLDLAILYTNSSITPVKIQTGNVNGMSSFLGSSIAFIGYPLSIPINGKNIPIQTTVRGSVSGIVPFPYQNQEVLVYVLGAAANKGNSGGPVFSLKTGEVIGIINKKFGEKESIAISTAINQNLINKLV